MTTPRYIRTWWIVMYDGTNSAQLLTAVQNITVPRWTWSIGSADANSCVILQQDLQGTVMSITVSKGQWLLVHLDTGNILRFSGALGFIPFTTLSDLATQVLNTSQVQAALQETGAFGLATVPSLIAGASTTVQVTIKPVRAATPDSTDVAALLYGAVNLLASLSVTAVTPVSGSRIDVTVKNTGLLTLSGGSVFVHVA